VTTIENRVTLTLEHTQLELIEQLGESAYLAQQLYE